MKIAQLVSKPRFVALVVALGVTLCVTSALQAQTVRLAWDANTEPDIAGYMVLYDTQSGSYSSLVNVGNVTSAQVGPLTSGATYYFVVKAFNTAGLVSLASNEVAFTVPSSPPAVTSISPSSGPTTGGTRITLSGSNFVNGATVRVGGNLCTAITFVSTSTLTATTPMGSPGAQSVQVQNPDGRNATLASAFTYTGGPLPPPTLTSISPRKGPKNGGTYVTLTGTNFQPGAMVRIGSAMATAVTYLGSTTLGAFTPGGTGNQTVTVTNPDTNSAQLTNAFTYTNSNLKLTSVSPTSGPTSGGTTLTLSGVSFRTGDSVTIADQPASSVTVVNATTIRAVVPGRLEPGPVHVTINDPVSGSWTLPNSFIYVAQPTSDDSDGDGMPDWWEVQFGLDPTVATGDNGALGDPDGDGIANIDEYRQGTHPRGYYKRYFAEGASNQFFSTRFALANPTDGPMHALLTFQDLAGQTSTKAMTLAARSRATLDASSMPSLAGASFSTVVESDLPVVADRLMMWDASGYGSSAETSVGSPSTIWYFAEGATHGAFDLYYLLQNANASPAHVTVRYLLPFGQAPIVLSYTVAPRSRFNIKVDDEPGLSATDVSAQITSDVPIIAERAMYFSTVQQPYAGGHASAGVNAPATQWFLAEGSTGWFSMYILVGNPSNQQAQIRATYMLPDGSTLQKAYAVDANSRFTIDVSNQDDRLRTTAVSTLLESTNGVPVIVERSMYWPNNGTGWIEGHNAVGLTVTGTKWMLAEGEQGGPNNQSTFVLVANTSSIGGDIKVTLLFEDGPEVSRVFTLLPNSRFNVPLDGALSVAQGKRFATIVESIGANPLQIVVERAMYSDANGVMWAAGSSAVGTKLQ